MTLAAAQLRLRLWRGWISGYSVIQYLGIRIRRRFFRGSLYLLFLQNFLWSFRFLPRLVDLDRLADLDRLLDLEGLVRRVPLAKQQRPEIEPPRLQKDPDEIPVGEKRSSSTFHKKELASVNLLGIVLVLEAIRSPVDVAICWQLIEMKLHRGSSIVHTLYIVGREKRQEALITCQVKIPP